VKLGAAMAMAVQESKLMSNGWEFEFSKAEAGGRTPRVGSRHTTDGHPSLSDEFFIHHRSSISNYGHRFGMNYVILVKKRPMSSCGWIGDFFWEIKSFQI